MTEKKKTAFEKALTEAVLSRYQNTISEDQEPVEFSEDYRNAVAKLTKKTQLKTWKYVNTAAKRILIAAIVIMLLTMTAFAAIPALREGLIRFFMHDDGVAYSFEFTEEDYKKAPREIETYYAPSWVPPQYALASEKYLPDVGDRIYLDETGNIFHYEQHVLWETGEEYDYPPGIGRVMTVSSDYATVETQIVQGYEVYVIQYTLPDGAHDTVFIWTDHLYFYMVSSAGLSDTEIVSIIDSMGVVANPT